MGKVELARIIDMDRAVPTCLRYRQGQADAAAQTLRRAYRVKRAVLGARHPDLAITLYAQARCTRVLGDSQRPAALPRKACDLLGDVVPPDQPTLAACRRQLAALPPGSRRIRPQAVVPALETKGTSQVRDGSESGLAAPPGA